MALLPEQSGPASALAVLPGRLPSLPEWLQRRIGELRKEEQADRTGKYRLMMVLPASMMLTPPERTTVEQQAATHSKLLELGEPITLHGRNICNADAHTIIIATKVLMKAGQKLDQACSDALTEDYLDAIEDLPAWAVIEALRKWNRAESAQFDQELHNFNFRPSPPTLRRLTLLELAPVKQRIQQFQDLLRAVPRVEFSDEHRKRMCALMLGLHRRLQTM